MKFYLRLRRFSAFIIGITFIISGIFKLLDPVGTGLIVKDYYSFFHLGFLASISKHVGWILALTETTIGLALTTGIWRKRVAIITICFLGFFTILTTILLIFNPSMDCGCFGEVIHLSHLETFIKNLILLALSAIGFFPFKFLSSPKKRKIYLFYAAFGLVIIFSVYSWLYLPIIDFTTYKPSSELHNPANNTSQNDSNFEASFVYEKNGIQEVFTLENLPDSTWTYIKTEVISNKNEVTTSMPTLYIYGRNGESKDELVHLRNTMLISIYKPQSINKRKWEKIADYTRNLEKLGFNPLILSSSINYNEAILSIENKGLAPESLARISKHLYTSDYKTLITLNRSNSGLTYISNSYIINKWANIARPNEESLIKLLEKEPTEIYIEKNSRNTIVYNAYLLIILLLVFI